MKPGGKPKPVAVNGQVYPSQAAAARAFGVSAAQVSLLVRAGRADEIRAEGRLRGHKRGGGKSPVLVRGTLYPSQAAAARALGVHPKTLQGALDRGTLDRVGQGRWPR